MKEQIIIIDESGDNLVTLAADDLPDFGPVQAQPRASNVEWELVEGSGGWDVILTREAFNGPYAGHVVLDPHNAVTLDRATQLRTNGQYAGFKKRADALACEVAFLNAYVLGRF